MLPDVCSESWLTSQTKDGQLSEFISGCHSSFLVGLFSHDNLGAFFMIYICP